MRTREISTSGIVKEDGRLYMPMEAVNAFFAERKGSRVVARFVIAPRKSSEALKGYYFHYVVPTIRQGLWETGERKTEQQTEEYLRYLSPICWDEVVDAVTGEYSSKLREIKELDNAELIEHIECVRQFAAEELNLYVEDPQTL